MKALIIIMILSFTAGGELSKSLEKKVNKNLRKSFGIENIIRKEIDLDTTFNDRPDLGLHFYTLEDKEQLLGYMIITTAKGRYDYFDYSVIYNPDLTIRDISILVYRSEHGYEISRKSWLEQFKGSEACDLVYGEQIDAISGATYSASSITEDLNRLCNLLPDLMQK